MYYVCIYKLLYILKSYIFEYCIYMGAQLAMNDWFDRRADSEQSSRPSLDRTSSFLLQAVVQTWACLHTVIAASGIPSLKLHNILMRHSLNAGASYFLVPDVFSLSIVKWV